MGVGVPVPEPRTFPHRLKILLHNLLNHRLIRQLKLKTQLVTVHRHRQILLTLNSLRLKMLQAQLPKTEIRQLLNRQQNKIKLICIEKHYIL